MQCRSQAILVLAFVLATFGGCQKKTESPTGPSAGDGTIGGGISGTPESGSRHLQITSSITRFADSVLALRGRIDAQALLSYFGTIPEFAVRGASPDGAVWGKFTDGRIFAYLITPNETSTGSPLATWKIAGSRPSLPKVSDHLPAGKKMIIMNAMGSAFESPTATSPSDAILYISSAFHKAGYDVALVDPTVDNLLRLQKPSVLYWSTHGNVIPLPDGTTIGVLWTSEVPDSAKNVKYADQLKTGDLIEIAAVHTRDNNGKVHSAVHYAITDKFVDDFMLFDMNSLVHVMACGGGNPVFHSAFHKAGVSMYGGWSHAVYGNVGADAARFFFDRMLGTNALKPIPNPPQRLMGALSVLEDMQIRGLTKSTTEERPTELSFDTERDDFTDLRPSIQTANLQGSDNLDVQGHFGDTPGTITLDGVPLQVVSWGARVIRVKHPAHGGNLQIEVGGVKSNIVQLTEWNTDFVYTFTGQGTLQQTVHFRIKFLADVHSYRIISGANNVWPDRSLFVRPRHAYVAPSSYATMECTGEYRSAKGDLLESWSGRDTLGLVGAGQTAGFFFNAIIDSVGSRANMFLMLNCQYTRFTAGVGYSQATMILENNVGAMVPTIQTGFVISGSTGSNSVGKAKLEWTRITPSAPPDPNEPS